MLLRYCLNDFETVPIALSITGITFVFTFHKRCIPVIIIIIIIIITLPYVSKVNCFHPVVYI